MMNQDLDLKATIQVVNVTKQFTPHDKKKKDTIQFQKQNGFDWVRKTKFFSFYNFWMGWAKGAFQVSDFMLGPNIY